MSNFQIITGSQIVETKRPIVENNVLEFLDRYGLNWQVSKKNLFAFKDVQNDLFNVAKNDIIESGFVGVFREDTQKCFYTGKDSYTPFQNDLFASLVIKFCESLNLPIKSVKVLKEGARLFAIIEKEIVPKNFAVVGDKIAHQIIISNSHDGSSALRVQFAHIFLTCLNGMVRTDKKGSISIRHTASLEKTLTSLLRGTDQLQKESDRMFAKYMQMATVKINKTHIDQVLVKCMQSPTVRPADILSDDLSTQSLNIKTDLLNSIAQECSYRGSNALGLFNGVTHRFTKLSNKSDSKMYSFLNGTAAKKSKEIFDYCSSI